MSGWSCSTIPGVQIKKLDRIESKPLWSFYEMQKTRMSKHLGHEPAEVHVWHGTSGLDPATIYEDKQVPYPAYHTATAALAGDVG